MGRPAWGVEHEAAQRQGSVKDYLVNENTKSEIGLHQAEAAKNYAEASAARAEATMAKAPMEAANCETNSRASEKTVLIWTLCSHGGWGPSCYVTRFRARYRQTILPGPRVTSRSATRSGLRPPSVLIAQVSPKLSFTVDLQVR